MAVERAAMNTPIQGTAADLLKLAMVRFKEPIVRGAEMVLEDYEGLREVLVGLERNSTSRGTAPSTAVARRPY